MGSSRRHSTGRQAGAFRVRKRNRSKLGAPQPEAPADFDAILGRLSDSLSIIATATNALAHAQQLTGTAARSDLGEEITTLEHGVRAFRGAYDELDVAVQESRS